LSTQTPSTLNDYFTPLLSHALRHIPPSQHAETPIYLLATAGMRLLPPQRQNALLKGTCKLLKSYPFQTGDNCENVQIISGEEEGMWGWVAVNYLMDGFGHAPSSSSQELLPLAPLADPPPDSSHDSPTLVDVKHHSPTFGFLDMGGASTQLAFSPTWRELERSGYPRDQLREVSLRLLSGEDVSWPVFVASWLGFGTNKVRERYVEGRVNKWKDAQRGKADMTPLEDPCLPAGLQHESTPSAPPFIGTGDFSTCLSQLHPLLLHSTPCPTDHCLFAGLPTPHIDFTREDQRGFIGVSEYWYTAQQVLGLGGVWDWAEWERGMGEFCARDWSDVKAEMEREKGWKGAQVRNRH
jgi:Golgi apyrase